MAHVVELRFEKICALLLGWCWAPRVRASSTVSILFHQGSLSWVLLPFPALVASLPGSCPPCWAGACSLGLHPASDLRKAAGNMDPARCWGCVCVSTGTHPHACSFPQRKTGSSRARAGGGSLEGFSCWLPLTHVFPVSVLSSWHPSCSLYVYVCYILLPPCAVFMLHPLLCKAP